MGIANSYGGGSAGKMQSEVLGQVHSVPRGSIEKLGDGVTEVAEIMTFHMIHTPTKRKGSVFHELVDTFKTPNVLEDGKKRVRKLGQYDKSPFEDREINPQGRNSTESMSLIHYVKSVGTDDNKVLFMHNGKGVIRNDFLSLHCKTHVSVNIIDVWAYILNDKERYRSNNSPRQFFSTTEPTLHPVVQHVWPTYARRYEVFEERLNNLTKMTPHTPLGDIDLAMFPILSSVHYYVICFNMKNYTLEIIDNSVPDDLDEKYGKIIVDLKMLFMNCLAKHGREDKALKLDAKAGFKLLHMHWRDNNNIEDCGIYAMRHMETYRGQTEKDWEC